MAELTYNQRMLRNVRQAIEEIVTGGVDSASQSVGSGGSESFKRLPLSELRQLESDYMRRVSAEATQPTRVRPDFGRCN